MAEAKLWWDGSAWVTTETTCVYSNSATSSSWAGVIYWVKLIAQDDFTISMVTRLYAASGYGAAVITGGTKTMKSGDTTIGTGTFTADVTPYTTFYWSGNVSCGENDYSTTKWHAGTANTASGTINVTESPFATITYNAHGGVGDVGTQTVVKSIATSVTPEAVPTRENYMFVGWNTEADGSGTAYANGANISATEDTTLYAQWSQTAFSVSISADEGATITLDGQSFTNQTDTIYKAAGTYALTITANSGYVIKTRSPANDGNISISADGTTLSATSQHVGCRIDDGANWVQSLIYVDDGGQWVMCQAYYDDGGQWILLN